MIFVGVDYDEFPICDNFKRVPLKGNNRTYHVDCNGYDINGTLIITGLDDCGIVYTDDPTDSYHSNLYWSYPLRYDLNDDLVSDLSLPILSEVVTAVDCSDFYHCSYYNKCTPFNSSSVWVSIEFSFRFFFNFEFSATRTK